MPQHGGCCDGRMLLQAKCGLHNRTGLNFEFEIVLIWGGVKQRDATIANEKAQTSIGSPPFYASGSSNVFGRML